MIATGERILVTFWVGALWTVGYVAVPLLFDQVGDRQLAGQLAGELFTAVSVIGVLCGMLLLTLALTRASGKGVWRSPRVLVLTAMVLLVLVEFLLQSLMGVTKAEGLVEGSRQAADFAALHGISSAVYLGMSLLGLVLVVLGPRDYFKAA